MYNVATYSTRALEGEAQRAVCGYTQVHYSMQH